MTFSAGETFDPQRTFWARHRRRHSTADRCARDRQRRLLQRTRRGRRRREQPCCVRRGDGGARTAGGANCRRGDSRLRDLQRGEWRDAHAAAPVLCHGPRQGVLCARSPPFTPDSARRHERSPATAIWSAALVLSGSFDQLLTYVVFVSWILVCVGSPRDFRLPAPRTLTRIGHFARRGIR